MERPACLFWELAYDLHPNEPLAKSGVLNRIFTMLQQKQILQIKIEVMCLDSTSVKVHPDGTGALKNMGYNLLGFQKEVVTPKFIWLPQVIGLQQFLICLPDRIMMPRKDAGCLKTAIYTLFLESINHRRAIWESVCSWTKHMKMIRHENWSRTWALCLLFLQNRIAKNHGIMTRNYTKKRNEVERLFRRIKGFRRIFTRYEKLDIMFIAFITFALIVDAIKQC